MSRLVKAGVRALAVSGSALLLSAAQPASCADQSAAAARHRFYLGNGMQVRA